MNAVVEIFDLVFPPFHVNIVSVFKTGSTGQFGNSS